MHIFLKSLTLACAAALLAACNGGGGDDDDPALSTGGDGVLTLDIGDAPVDNLQEVNITVTAIEFGGDEGSTSDEAADVIELDSPVTVNLLEYQNGDFFNLLDTVDVSEGEYSWIRLRLDYDDRPPEVLEKNSLNYKSLDIPSGEQTGLKLQGGGTLVIDGSEDHHYAIDIDLHRSLIQTGNGDYKLRPTYRLIDLNGEVFSISGAIDVNREIGCNGAIYVFKGNVTPDDIENPDDGESVSGVTSEDTVEPEIVVVVGSLTTYEINNLTAGTYTLAFTCDVDEDELDEDNDGTVVFLGREVVTNATSTMTNVDITD